MVTLHTSIDVYKRCPLLTGKSTLQLAMAAGRPKPGLVGQLPPTQQPPQQKVFGDDEEEDDDEDESSEEEDDDDEGSGGAVEG